MRILFALSGLHRISRGAEVAFTSVGAGLARLGHHVVLAGSGHDAPEAPYEFLHIPAANRKRFEFLPKLPLMRDETALEDLSFAAGLLLKYRPADFDVTLTCSYPYTNWALRRPTMGRRRPAHVFVTQNGDWPSQSTNSEYRFFGCDGLVCTNPDFFERNQAKWRCGLIPNGVDAKRFASASPAREQFGLPNGAKIVLMTSALISTKRVREAIDAVSAVPDVHLVVAGDGPERKAIAELAAEKLRDRFTNLIVPSDRMPALYASADVFLHMALSESFGNIFVEALAAGLPIVGHDSSRLRWILADMGTLIDTTNLAEVSEAINSTNPSSPAQRADRQKAAESFDWSVIAKKYETFLADVCSSSPAGGSIS